MSRSAPERTISWRRVAVALVLLAMLVAFLYTLGTWWIGDGYGPQVQSAESLQRRAQEIAMHRDAQRAGPAVQADSGHALSPSRSTPDRPLDATVATITPYWTDFRGPRRDAHYREQPIRVDWPATGLRPLWKQPVGGGHASFVIANGRAYTIEQRGREEMVAAYDVRTGRELWTSAWLATFSETYGGVGPRATPTWHAGTLYALGATGELRALDAVTGKTRWRTNILEDAAASNLEWGMAASPLVMRDTVIVFPGGGGGRSLVAYRRNSGQRAWAALDDDAAYSSPMVVTLAGVEQILIFTAPRLVGLSLDGARVLWELPWRTQSGINVAQPLVIGDNRVFLSSGYGMGAALIQVSRDGDGLAVHELWRTNRMKNQFTTSVHQDGFIYGLDEAILACLDAETGELKWKGGRYGYGQVMLASGHLIILTESGDLALVRATPERHVEIARFPALDGRTWNHPAMAEGYLLVRNATEMAAFDLRVGR